MFSPSLINLSVTENVRYIQEKNWKEIVQSIANAKSYDWS